MRKFAPGISLVSSTRIGKHINPSQSFQLSHDFLHFRETSETNQRQSKAKNLHNWSTNYQGKSPRKGSDAEGVIRGLMAFFGDFSAFPNEKQEGAMDFVCKLESKLSTRFWSIRWIEIQVIPCNDFRALSYETTFHGNHLKRR